MFFQIQIFTFKYSMYDDGKYYLIVQNLDSEILRALSHFEKFNSKL